MRSVVYLVLLLVCFSCSNSGTEEKKRTELVQDTIAKINLQDTMQLNADTVLKLDELVDCTNDSLNELARWIAGFKDTGDVKILKEYYKTSLYKLHSASFGKKWLKYDSVRITQLSRFRDEKLNPVKQSSNFLFYPFSGPDILYAQSFFPEADEYLLMGLEPVGTLPIYDERDCKPDSMNFFYQSVNTSLHAILKYSFFRTASMKTDLKNEELDGTLHLLMLFLSRMNNKICAAKPIRIDSTGNIVYESSFVYLKKKNFKNPGIEIDFTDSKGKFKKLRYFSLNLANGGLKYNKGMMRFLGNLPECITYLKGASYLMHKDYFGMIKDVILEKSKQVIQDDSGIALRYFLKDNRWDFKFFGNYIKPIPMFSEFYQRDLDSLYKLKGSQPIGFGIGYNFKDKSSHLMIAEKNK